MRWFGKEREHLRTDGARACNLIENDGMPYLFLSSTHNRVLILLAKQTVCNTKLGWGGAFLYEYLWDLADKKARLLMGLHWHWQWGIEENAVNVNLSDPSDVSNWQGRISDVVSAKILKVLELLIVGLLLRFHSVALHQVQDVAGRGRGEDRRLRMVVGKRCRLEGRNAV